MTPMPLLPAQPKTTLATSALGADPDTGSGGTTSGGRTFADLLAVGAGSAEGALQSGPVASNPASAGTATKHPGQHRRPAEQNSDRATAGAQLSPTGPTAILLPPQQPAAPARPEAAGAARAEAADTVTGKSAPSDGPPPGPNSAVLAATASRGPTTVSTAGSALGDPARSPDSAPLAGVLTGASTTRTPPDFGNLMSQFGTPIGTGPDAPDGRPAPGSPRMTAAGGPSAANQPAPKLTGLDRVAGGSAQIPEARRPAGEHAPGQSAVGPMTSGHPVLATGSTLLPAVLVPTPPPAATHPTASPATAPSAMPTPTAADQPMPAPLHTQVAGPLLELRARGNGTHRVLLDLHPADLGQVTVEVRMHAGTVSIDLGSANPDARHSLTQALPQLRAELADAGLGGASVSVGADTSGGSAPRRDGDAGQHRAAPFGSTGDVALGSAGNIPSDGPSAATRTTDRLTGVDRWL